jgi:hypothetical protein
MFIIVGIEEKKVSIDSYGYELMDNLRERIGDEQFRASVCLLIKYISTQMIKILIKLFFFKDFFFVVVLILHLAIGHYQF